MAAILHEFASQSDGLGFRGVLGRENASLTEELTAELAGILSWVVGRVGPADPSGEFTEPISTIERKSPSLNFRLRVLIAPREACEDPQDLPSCTRQGSRAGEARSTNWNGHIMTKPISASEQGLKPHYRVRVVLLNALLHLGSWTEPKIDQDLTICGSQATGSMTTSAATPLA